MTSSASQTLTDAEFASSISSSSSLSASRNAGIYKDYLQGLDNIRNQLVALELDFHKALDQFYKKSQTAPAANTSGKIMETALSSSSSSAAQANVNTEEEQCHAYLMRAFHTFSMINQAIGLADGKSTSYYQSHTPPVMLDGQTKIAEMMNRIRQIPLSARITDTTENSENASKTKSQDEITVECLEFATDFWENIRYTTELFQMNLDRFSSTVLNRLETTSLPTLINSPIGGGGSAAQKFSSGTTANSANTNNSSTHPYQKEIGKFNSEITDLLTKSRLLLSSSGSAVDQSLFTNSSLVTRLTRDIDVATYALLRLVPDITGKFERISQLARSWLDREETFVLEIGQQIRASKLQMREKEASIKREQKSHRDILQTLKSSYLMCQNSKHRLHDIGKELKSLENQIVVQSKRQLQLSEEKLKTQSMVEFLKLSISQTRKNYNLQLKRHRLQRQLGELETNLLEMDTEIEVLKQEFTLKSSQRVQFEENYNNREQSYSSVKEELDVYSNNIRSIHQEMNQVKASLRQLETIQTLKTSPEFVENLFEEEEQFEAKPFSNTAAQKQDKTATTTSKQSSNDTTNNKNSGGAKLNIKLASSLQDKINIMKAKNSLNKSH